MPETCGNRDDMHGVARKCERGMQACECGGALTRAYQIDEPRQIARAQRVDLTLATVDLEGLGLR